MQKDNMETIYWIHANVGNLNLIVAATGRGLCYVGSPDAPFEVFALWAAKHIPGHKLVESKENMEPYTNELKAYMDGKQKEFSFPLDLRGTEFQRKVWNELLKVPFGQAATYTDIALRLNRPDAVRAVGTAIGANPVLITVPCHRMFGKHGEWRGYRGGMKMKEQLVELENIRP